MLVHCKTPKGILYIGKETIYGRDSGREPSDISFVLYEACREAFEDATYRESYLAQKFNWNQGEIAFTYGELRWLPETTLRKLANGIGIDESKRETKKQLVEDIKRALRDVVTS